MANESQVSAGGARSDKAAEYGRAAKDTGATPQVVPKFAVVQGDQKMSESFNAEDNLKPKPAESYCQGRVPGGILSAFGAENVTHHRCNARIPATERYCADCKSRLGEENGN